MRVENTIRSVGEKVAGSTSPLTKGKKEEERERSHHLNRVRDVMAIHISVT